MTGRWKIAFGCYMVVVAVGALVGVAYLFRSEFMPYHAAAVGKEWSAVEPRMQALVIGFHKVVGGGCLSSALGGGLVLVYGFRRQERWAAWAVPAIGLVLAVPALWAALHVQYHTSAATNWIAPAVAITLLVAGLVLSRPWR